MGHASIVFYLNIKTKYEEYFLLMKESIFLLLKSRKKIYNSLFKYGTLVNIKWDIYPIGFVRDREMFKWAAPNLILHTKSENIM